MDDEMTPSEHEVKRLLDHLCVKLGFCLSPADTLWIQEHTPNTPDSFTDAVYKAEGLDPLTAERHLYRQVRNIVREAFRKAEDNSA
jgi:hypothetical protein